MGGKFEGWDKGRQWRRPMAKVIHAWRCVLTPLIVPRSVIAGLLKGNRCLLLILAYGRAVWHLWSGPLVL
eukprot:1188695-Prorocentrum_minimum.AAC.3